jgi:hypothetical protein
MPAAQNIEAKPLIGKTYSLQGPSGDSDEYYRLIGTLAHSCLSQFGPSQELLETVDRARRNKRSWKKSQAARDGQRVTAAIADVLYRDLSKFTTSVEGHLKSLPLLQRWDRTLSMNRNQYHFAMLEIELVNRIHVSAFRQCDVRLAFLPHCLRDLSADCRSAVRGEDYVCKGCSKVCTVNAVSKLLRRHGVTPYIWMTANLRSLFTKLQKDSKKVGVLGIACVPELVRGMRRCFRAGVPVVGIPLDANRCARWWGEFHPNCVNVRVLENLLGDETRISRMNVLSRNTVSIGR